MARAHNASQQTLKWRRVCAACAAVIAFELLRQAHAQELPKIDPAPLSSEDAVAFGADTPIQNIEQLRSELVQIIKSQPGDLDARHELALAVGEERAGAM